MQSWGTARSRWDVRDTGLEPTKSGVIGLLGCALGLPRGSQRLEELDHALRFGVRVERPGVIARDFQTVSGYHRTAAGQFKLKGNRTTGSLKNVRPDDEATVLSPRDYLHDAIFLAALQGPESEISALELALAAPCWPLYLGRKNCPPTRPVLDSIDSGFQSIEDALRGIARHKLAPVEGALTAYIEDNDGDLERQDAIRVNTFRSFGFRKCRYIEVNPPCS